MLRDRRGGSALEFALVALPFVLVMLGTIEFGRVIFYQNALSNATTAASRLLLIDPSATSEGLKQYITARVLNIDAARLTVTFSDAEQGGVIYRTVGASYDFDLMVPTLFDFEIVLQKDTVVPLL